MRCWKLKSSCHFTYSPKTQQEQIFRKSLIVSYRVTALQLNFLEILLLSYIVVSQKFKLKLIGAKFLLPMISRNELSVTLSTLWYSRAHRRTVAGFCTLYKIRCNRMNPLYGSLPVPYVPVWVTYGPFVTHQTLMHLLDAERSSTVELNSTLSETTWLPCIRLCGISEFCAKANVYHGPKLLASFFFFYSFPFRLLLPMRW